LNRLVIDITELVHWQGKLTGVPRVMNELSSRFAANAVAQEIVFVTWDSHKNAFEAVDYVPAAVDPTDEDIAKPGEPSGVLETTKQLVRKSRIASRAVELTKGGVKSLATGSFRVTRSHRQILRLQSGDTLLILADWHGSNEKYMSLIEDIKQLGVRLVQISYDLLPIVAPQYSGHSTKKLTHYVKRIYPLCDLILTISEQTTRDIETWLKSQRLSLPRIEKMRLGDDFHMIKTVRPKDKKMRTALLKNTNYLLCVGTVEARKNHTLLYYTYKLAAERGIQLPILVIVGRQGWLASDIYEIISNDPITKGSIIFLQNISDAELSWLYEHCLFSIYPSFYEGWGLPVAESIAHGVPCLCSSTSSIPEIAGDLLEYFSPYSSEECLAKIQLLLKPAALEQAKAKVGAYQPTSWDESFAFVNKVIGEIHG
jgi:glycosyltransferase involved in cell wall biosynthesis